MQRGTHRKYFDCLSDLNRFIERTPFSAESIEPSTQPIHFAKTWNKSTWPFYTIKKTDKDVEHTIGSTLTIMANANYMASILSIIRIGLDYWKKAADLGYILPE